MAATWAGLAGRWGRRGGGRGGGDRRRPGCRATAATTTPLPTTPPSEPVPHERTASSPGRRPPPSGPATSRASSRTGRTGPPTGPHRRPRPPGPGGRPARPTARARAGGRRGAEGPLPARRRGHALAVASPPASPPPRRRRRCQGPALPAPPLQGGQAGPPAGRAELGLGRPRGLSRRPGRDARRPVRFQGGRLGRHQVDGRPPRPQVGQLGQGPPQVGRQRGGGHESHRAPHRRIALVGRARRVRGLQRRRRAVEGALAGAGSRRGSRRRGRPRGRRRGRRRERRPHPRPRPAPVPASFPDER